MLTLGYPTGGSQSCGVMNCTVWCGVCGRTKSCTLTNHRAQAAPTLFNRKRSLPEHFVTCHIIRPFSPPHSEKGHKSRYTLLSFYCLIKIILVSFCFSKMSVLVFPPHSAPFITGWYRQTYCSYFPRYRRGRNSKAAINFNKSDKEKNNYFSTFSHLCQLAYL